MGMYEYVGDGNQEYTIASSKVNLEEYETVTPQEVYQQTQTIDSQAYTSALSSGNQHAHQK